MCRLPRGLRHRHTGTKLRMELTKKALHKRVTSAHLYIAYYTASSRTPSIRAMGGDKCPTMDVFFLWALISSDAYVNLPFLLADFLVERAGKDRQGSPSYGCMLIMRLMHSFGVLDKREAMFLRWSHINHSLLTYTKGKLSL